MSDLGAKTADVKQCCALAYGSDAARFLLGDSFHPGGIALTLELAGLMKLNSASLLLDVASGKGTSAFAVAEHFGCRVIGVDLSEANIAASEAEATKRGLNDRVQFRLADAEQLPFEAASFDAILCECAFCTFPNKATAAAEFTRVLRAGGRVGISDLTRVADPLPELDGLLAWIVRNKLLLADIMIGLKKLDLPGLDIQQAKQFAVAAADAIKHNKLGYAILIGELAAS